MNVWICTEKVALAFIYFNVHMQIKENKIVFV